MKQVGIYATVMCIFYLMPFRLDDDSYIQGIVAILMLGGLGYAIARQLQKKERRFFDLVALIFTAAHACAFACFVLAMQAPGQFEGIATRTDALYFTVATMATVGFGDIHPAGQAAKMLVIVMIVFDLVFIAALCHAVSESLVKRRMV
ncbi:potassium channel family protein [Corynebacterium mastitidis]|uniref:Potassium channel family protein n=1 Tax=Corynebacterium mastitidis TaxID=161890 RepID=A0ABU8NZL3_9CORY